MVRLAALRWARGFGSAAAVPLLVAAPAFAVLAVGGRPAAGAGAAGEVVVGGAGAAPIAGSGTPSIVCLAEERAVRVPAAGLFCSSGAVAGGVAAAGLAAEGVVVAGAGFAVVEGVVEPGAGAIGAGVGVAFAGRGAAGAGAGVAFAGRGAAGVPALDVVSAGLAAAVPVARCVPSTRMAAPQCLHLIRTFFPRTFWSGMAYFAGQLPQETFMVLCSRPAGRQRAAPLAGVEPLSLGNAGFHCIFVSSARAEAEPSQLTAINPVVA